jgi:hypothetical protein
MGILLKNKLNNIGEVIGNDGFVLIGLQQSL